MPSSSGTLWISCSPRVLTPLGDPWGKTKLPKHLRVLLGLARGMKQVLGSPRSPKRMREALRAPSLPSKARKGLCSLSSTLKCKVNPISQR